MLVALHFIFQFFSFFIPIFGQHFAKPSFKPYCVSSDIMCKVICKCQVQESCTLLPMDNEMRENILLYFNRARDIQTNRNPQPSGLSVLQYDRNLEELATCWAVACENAYTDCLRTPNFPNSSQAIGQTNFKGKFPTVDLWYNIVSHWLKEMDDMNTTYIRKIPYNNDGFEIHNFAQVMSDKVLFVGCAWSMSKEVLNLLCSFAPSGPIQGQRIYKTGSPCSSCPDGYQCNHKQPFTNLCKLKSVQVTQKPNKTISYTGRPPSPKQAKHEPEQEQEGVRINKIPLLLTVIVSSIVVCIFLSIVFLTGYYVMYF